MILSFYKSTVTAIFTFNGIFMNCMHTCNSVTFYSLQTRNSVTFYFIKNSFSAVSRKWILPNMIPALRFCDIHFLLISKNLCSWNKTELQVFMEFMKSNLLCGCWAYKDWFESFFKTEVLFLSISPSSSSKFTNSISEFLW